MHRPTEPANDSSRKPFASFAGIEAELDAEGLFALANWFDDTKINYKALEFYQKALDLNPSLAPAHHNMGVIYTGRQDRENAVAHFEQAIQHDPSLTASYSALGLFRFAEKQFEQALTLLEQAVVIDPHFAEGHFNMGIILQQMGSYRRSMRCFQKASACSPSFAPARWLCQLGLPLLYDAPEEIDVLRRQFSNNLDALIRSVRLDTPEQIQYAVQGIQSMTNFYLQYQGRNDLELQKKYGQWVHTIMTAGYPQWRSCPSPLPPGPGEKIRIGYISAFMSHHTVGTFLAGWMENHDRDAFEIYCYHLGPKRDALTDHLCKLSHRFYHISGNFEAAATQIAADRPHLLVYNEVGMNIEGALLAALRLAPVQCLGWGHPVTTGLPTMDYFLTSDLMEPDDADQHYSETLVRLPNISLCYHPPKLPEHPRGRASLGLPQERFIFLSSQSIYKYLPQHDEIYPLIAMKAPNAYFVFISHQSPHVTHRLRKRLKRAFERHHLDVDRYCFFSPRLDAEGFLSLNMASDAFLDTFEWSGGKTTLEAISAGLPVVTCPGRYMRGRHAYAMLKRMEIDETIARDMASYCAIAARLATDGAFYSDITKRFAEQRRKLYNDKAFIVALEKQYRSMVHVGTATDLKDEGSAEHWFQTANASLKQMDVQAAIPAYEKALVRHPDWDAAHYNLAVALHMAENDEQAICHAMRAIEINPDYANAHALLFRLAQHACDWPLVEKASQHLDRITRLELTQGAKTTEPPMTNLRRCSDVQLNFEVACSWSRQLSRLTRQQPPLPDFDIGRLASQRIRVGYLSADFKDHAVAYQIKGLLEKHDRKHFDIFGYACNPDNGSPYRRQLSNRCDHFRDVHAASNRSIAEQIRKDGIHILVDMAGHSKDNRLGIAAFRPAPVQVSYLGFLGTIGSNFIDYVLADPIVLPKAHHRFYTEKIGYLPHCYQANDDRLVIAPQKPERRQWHLPDNAFVFCSFNQPYKIDSHLFRVWMRILNRVENSVLWLVERSGPAPVNLRRAAKRAGVDPARLIFTGFVPMDQNLARLQLADLMLDTMTYNGGATTSNALWAGVPVLTILGDHWVSRMSASALHCMGLDELITDDLAAYERTAVGLAKNLQRLTDMRQRLLHQRSVSALFNTSMFTRHVEKAYQYMWKRYACGLPAASFQVEPER